MPNILKLQKVALSNEQGFASLVIGLILVLVMGLMAVGFAQLTRHEQKQALGNQLATQAYYAAESGINDVMSALQADEAKVIRVAENQPAGCIDDGVLKGQLGIDPDIDLANTGTAYTCVMIDTSTPSLDYSNLDVGASKAVETTVTPNPSAITVTWTQPGSTVCNNPTTDFYPLAAATGTTWGDCPAVIQFGITPITGTTVSRDTLINNTYTAYLYPTSGPATPGTYSSAAANQGQVLKARCTTTGSNVSCTSTINVGSTGTNHFLFHFLNLYHASDSVKITSAGGGTFSGGQLQVDVTGKARDTFKRLRVSIPLKASDVPGYSIEAQNVCKRSITRKGSTIYSPPASSPLNTNGCEGEDPSGGSTITGQAGISTQNPNPGGVAPCQTPCGNRTTQRYTFNTRVYNVKPNAPGTVKSCTYIVDGTPRTFAGGSFECSLNGYLDVSFPTTGFIPPSDAASVCAKPKAKHTVGFYNTLIDNSVVNASTVYGNEPYCYY